MKFFFLSLIFLPLTGIAADRILILDGRNNHDWVRTTKALKDTLASSGEFQIDVSTAPEDRAGPAPKRPKIEDETYRKARAGHQALVKSLKPDLDARWEKWNPDFKAYQAVVLNYNGPEWPAAMKRNFVEFVKNGGGVLLVHAANNGFSNWEEFNEMIGLGWRKGGVGKCLIINNDGLPGECCADDSSGHGSKHPFLVTHRKPQHPILNGLPVEWLHAKDELYHHMRGPAENVTILASAFSDKKQRGTGNHEPVLWEVPYGKGRVIVCTLGHVWKGDTDQTALDCIGFQALLNRSVDYVIDGVVSQSPPQSFPTREKAILSPPVAPLDHENERLFKPLSPKEEAETFILPEGYLAECIASEPMVQEPVLTVWDGNGAMYVAEMRSYMQDEAGTGTKTLKNGRIKRLTDTNGDGMMDVATVFVDGLNLPRMILPLDDRIAVVETDTTTVWSYRDTTGDGVADEKTLLFQGKDGDGTRSVEHQPSGLDWNLDNWINVTYARERYRFTDGTWRAESLKGLWTQWGLTHDDTGRLFYSTNSDPSIGHQLARPYWNHIRTRSGANPRPDEPITLGLAWDMDFLEAKNLCSTDDRGGPAGPRKNLTSLCGQSIYRGQSLPAETHGNYFICDPTIHVVRRAAIENRNGRVFFTNPHGEDEFMLSPDIFFRPVSTATAPDGSLIVTDMYRGIIQDAPWLSPGPRKFIKESGLADVNQRGRIWRIRHIGSKLQTNPKMLDKSTVELVRHLENPNGWWRDTAQRLIILREDRESVTPALIAMARAHHNPLARLHALWTLEGMDKAAPSLLLTLFGDKDTNLRAAALRISEPLIAKKDQSTLSAIAAMAHTEQDPEVAAQIILSLGYLNDPSIIPICDPLIKRFLTHEQVYLAACAVFWKHPTPYLLEIQSGKALEVIADLTQRSEVAARWTQGMAQWERGLALPKDMPADRRRFIQNGEAMYFTSCVSCHGADGRGVTLPGTDMMIAPSLADSARVVGPLEQLVPVLLNGLIGPIEDKTFEGQFMVPASALGITRDDRLAEAISYIRYAWGNNADSISADEVKTFRKQHETRTAPWTDTELKELAPAK
ncbi:ThuA domain-containing protein [Verrucomicrobiaceae bacterium 227]